MLINRVLWTLFSQLKLNVQVYSLLDGRLAFRCRSDIYQFLSIFQFPLQTMLTAISMSAIATNGVVPGNPSPTLRCSQNKSCFLHLSAAARLELELVLL